MMRKACRSPAFNHHLTGVVVADRSPINGTNSQAAAIIYEERASRSAVTRDDSPGNRRVVHDFQERDMLLDFEGSMVKGVEKFYQSFGAVPEYYSYYKKRFLSNV